MGGQEVPGDRGDKEGEGGGLLVTAQLDPPNQESLKEVVPGFSQHLGQMGRPLWMHRERLQTQMERVQRWGVCKNETRRVWARLWVFLET